MRTLFLLVFVLSFHPIQAKVLKIHLYDTGFCPSLIKAPENILIHPVVDVTQKNNYQCNKGELGNLRFHGQWVLEEVLKDVNTDLKIEITPLIIFDNRGTQKLSFWKRAFDYSKNNQADIILAAAGAPLLNDKEKRESAKIELPKATLFLSAGRRGKNISQNDILFPQIHHNKKQIQIIGSYHQGINESGPHFRDIQLLNPESISYYFPFEEKDRVYKDLKGSSFSLAKFGNFLLKNCFQKAENLPLEECLQNHRVELSLKHGKAISKVSGLK